jgi:hypothetical protein
MEFSNMFAKAINIFVQLRTNNACKRTSILAMQVLFVGSQMIPSSEKLEAHITAVAIGLRVL